MHLQVLEVEVWSALVGAVRLEICRALLGHQTILPFLLVEHGELLGGGDYPPPCCGRGNSSSALRFVALSVALPILACPSSVCAMRSCILALHSPV